MVLTDTRPIVCEKNILNIYFVAANILQNQNVSSVGATVDMPVDGGYRFPTLQWV